LSPSQNQPTWIGIQRDGLGQDVMTYLFRGIERKRKKRRKSEKYEHVANLSAVTLDALVIGFA
jgi:hypothetical protein